MATAWRNTKNIIEYTKLAEYLTNLKDKSDFDFGFSRDPVMGVARGMFVLAKAYDRLSTSFDKFGIALEKINMDKLREIKSLQTDQLANDLAKIKSEPEEKGIWASVKSTFGFGDSPTVGDKSKKKVDTFDKTKYGNNGKTIPEQLDILIGLLTNIDGSTNKIDEYISSIDDSIVNVPPKL